MPIPFPRTTRNVFNLFRLYQPGAAVPLPLDRIDWTGVTPGHIYLAVFDRPPESANAAIPAPGFDPARRFLAALQSEEFQDNVVRLLLHAFPEKRRMIFVHVPKCAGTDLVGNLEGRHLTVNNTIRQQFWVSQSMLPAVLCDHTANIDLFDSIFFHGHIQLDWILANRMRRIEDQLFTVVRDPVDIMISMVNYILSRLLNPEDQNRPDTKAWRRALGLEESVAEWGQEAILDLARRTLFDPDLVGANYICTHLGTGTAESALDLLARSDIEITDMRRYKAWLHERWGIEASSRLNASRMVLTRDNMGKQALEYVMERTDEDRKIHERIVRCLDAAGGVSVTGLDVNR